MNKTAGEKAYSNILPNFQKELERIYLQRPKWIRQLKEHVYKTSVSLKAMMIKIINHINICHIVLDKILYK